MDIDLTNTLFDNNYLSFHHFTNDNIKLKNYITEKFDNNQNFIIPRIAGIENVFAYLGMGLFRKDIKWDYLKYREDIKAKWSTLSKEEKVSHMKKYINYHCKS